MRATRFLFGKIWQYDKRMIGMIVLFSVLSAVYPFIWVYVPTAIIRLASQATGAVTDVRNELFLLLGVAAVLAVACTSALAYLRGNYRMRMNNIRYRLIRELIRYGLSMPYENTLNRDKLDEIQRAYEAVYAPWQGAGGIMLTLLQVFGTAVAVVGFVGVFLSLSLWMMLLILVVIALNLLFNHNLSNLVHREWDEMRPTYRKIESLFREQQDPLARKDFLSYSLHGLFKSYTDRYILDMRFILESVLKRKVGWQTALALVDLVKDAVVYGWLISLYLRGDIDIALFFFYSSGVITFVALAQQLMFDLTSIRRDAGKLSSYIELSRRASPADSPYGKPAATLSPSSFSTRSDAEDAITVDIRNVSFRYPGTEHWVLRDVNLSIKTGEKIALVGENGSGKTTLVMLLSRLYRPSEGEILFNGINIWDYDEDDFRALLGVVFQDAIILPFSISENITLSSNPDEVRLQKAIDSAAFTSTVSLQKNGLDTTLLRILDDEGVDLSGGQRQKLFLSRALYKDTSRILLLDEPTAALDALAEQELYQHYHELTEGQTSVFVSHRLASTQFCDRVAFLSDGKIAELGSHEELFARGGLYHDMYEIQAKNYRMEGGG